MENKISKDETSINKIAKKSKLQKEKNICEKKFSTTETIWLVVLSLIIGVSIGGLFSKTSIITKKSVLSDEYLKRFAETYQNVLSNYYKETDKGQLINSAIEGMLESLEDPYSMYFNETESENFSSVLEGSYEGIGVQVSSQKNNKGILINAVFEKSPAYVAGLKVGDIILSVDEISVLQLEISEFSSMIKNSDKANFKFKILRGEKEMEVIIEKSVVELSSVSSKIIEKKYKKIGYIYIGVFAYNTYDQFRTCLDSLEKQNIDSLIIDVRGNSGGHLISVDSILDLFLSYNQKMYGVEQSGVISYTNATGSDNKKYEIVVLGDELSASASEVLIAGLRDNLGIKFFGKQTYGKGTVQEMVTLSDGTKYKLTTKRWLTPNGDCVSDTVGIVPDVDVDLGDKYYETFSDDDDNQIQRAIEYLTNVK